MESTVVDLRFTARGCRVSGVHRGFKSQQARGISRCAASATDHVTDVAQIIAA